MNHIDIFKMCFPNYRSVTSSDFHYHRFYIYNSNDINYRDDDLYIDLERGAYIIFSTKGTELKILKTKELLDVINSPF